MFVFGQLAYCSLQAGVAFTDEGKVHVTGNNVVVPYVLQTKVLLEPLNRARVLAGNVKWNIEHMNNESMIVQSLKVSLSNFDAELEKLSVSFTSYLSLLLHDATATSRHKRGALNVLGDISHALFGTATQEQVDTIHNRIDELSSLTEEQRRQLNLHTEILNVTARNMAIMGTALQRLEKAVNLSDYLIRGISIQTLQNEEQIRILEALLDLSLALVDIQNDHFSIRLGLQEMLAGHFSSFLVPSGVLLKILYDASLMKPGLLFPARPEYLLLYWDTITVVPRFSISSHDIVFYLLIPLRGEPDDVFQIYKITSLPFSVPNSTYFVRHDGLATYLAISESRRHYV